MSSWFRFGLFETCLWFRGSAPTCSSSQLLGCMSDNEEPGPRWLEFGGRDWWEGTLAFPCPDSGTLQGFPGEENVRERMKWDSEVRVCEGRAPPCPGEGSEKPGRLGAAGRVPGRPNQCPSGSPHLQQPWTTRQMMARGHLCTGLTPSGDSKWW